MKRRLLKLAVCTLLGVAIFCVAVTRDYARLDKPQVRVPTTAPVWVWDLSDGHGIDRVGWPDWVTDTIWFIDGPQTVHLVLPGGETGDVTFADAKIARVGSTLRNVTFSFACETTEQAYRRATDLAKQWKITDTAELEEWHKTRGASLRHGAGYVSLSRDDLPQPRGITVRDAFSPGMWGLSFGFGFPDELNSGRATKVTR